MDNIIYNEDNDRLYILTYILGSGMSADVWFAIEFVNFVKNIKSKKFDFDCKALKIFFKNNTSEYRREKKINNILVIDDEKCKYINYPLFNFNYNNNDIIVYDVMYDLYELCKLFNFEFEDNFKDTIIRQMRESIYFVHKCGYIHTDIKINNFLLIAINEIQNDVLKYVKNYNFKNILNKNFNKYDFKKILETIDKELLKFIENLYRHFNFEDNFDNNYSSENNSYESNNDNSDNSDNENSDNENSDNENSDNENCDNEEGKSNTETNNSDLSSYNTSNSSFESYRNEYEKKYDKFHLKRIFNDINNGDDEENLKKNDEKIIKKKYLLKYIKEPILKLTDFGLMKKGEVSETTNARNYRCPEIILGYKCGKEVDYWSLEMTIYELINGKMLYNYHKMEEHGFYDNDLISMKLILENSNKEKYNEYIDLIKKSNRNNYILTKQKTLLFYKKI